MKRYELRTTKGVEGLKVADAPMASPGRPDGTMSAYCSLALLLKVVPG
jgi:hypothetical protein